MQTKTIAFYNREYPGGGGETVTRNLGLFFRSRGLRVVVYAGKLVEEKLTERERRDFTLTAVPRLSPDSKEIDYDAFCRSLADERIDCLIVQGASHMAFERIRRETGCKILFCLHSIPLWEVYAARNMRCSELPKPTLLRKLEFLLLRRPLNLLTDKLERRTLKRYAAMMPHIDRLIMLCPEYREQMERMIRRSGYPGSDAPGEKYVSLLNPLLPPAPPVDRDLQKEKTVLYVGRLMRVDKRVDRLLMVWRKIESAVPEWRLRILGTGEEADALQKQAARLGLRRVEFLGHRMDVTPYYRRAAFVCLTSNFEGLPMSLMEGQQYGAIPVSFDSYAGIREITDNGRAGLMVPAYSIAKYADVLISAFADRELQKRMREACYRAAERYELERIGEEWLRLFDKL